MKLLRIGISIILLAEGLSPNANVHAHDRTINQTSRAQVRINNGFLSLDSIPDLNFTNVNSSNEYHLYLADYNRDNRVRVTDYRNQDRPGNHHPLGWRLRVSSPQLHSNSYLKLSNRDAHNTDLTSNVTLSSQHPAQNIMGSYYRNGYGTYTTDFNRPSDATLDVPNATTHPYHVDVNWDLYTPLNSNVNDS